MTADLATVPHVLVVDDDRRVLAALSRVLGQMKINIHLADGPDSALKVLDALSIDAVISDYRMPKMDGGHFLRQVQSRWPDTVRILVTAYPGLPEVEEAARQAGVFRVLEKPCGIEELRSAIQEALIWRDGEQRFSAPRELVVDDRLFRRLFDAAADPMMLAELDGRIREVNYAFVRSMGGTYRAALEKRPTITSGWHVAWPAVYRALLQDGHWSGEARHITTDAYAVFTISVLTDESGSPCALAAVERDITSFRRLEQESRNMQYNVPLAIAKLAEFREQDTGKHLERIRSYCWTLAVEVARSPHHALVIDSAFLDAIYAASPLHDVGKVGIPDDVLLKPGALNATEWEIMRTHSRIGAEILTLAGGGAMTRLWLEMGRVIALQHHERWDGTGYPAGLKGEEIDLAARIVALADAYDAITSKRCYKDALSHQEACTRLVSSSGTHFDPEIVAAFQRVAGAFQETMQSVREEQPAPPPLEARSATGLLRRINSMLPAIAAPGPQAASR
jgi:response regulator RpfG family c-di-GMP phosphodiesterase